MAHFSRKTLAVLVLVAGIVWSLPMQQGRDDSRAELPAYSAMDAAEFRVSSYRTSLDVTGHTWSALHEQRLADAISENFPMQETRLHFRPLGVAPAWWDEATTGLMSLLASMRSLDAYLSEDTLRIRAVVDDELAAKEKLKNFRDVLPETTQLDASFTLVDKRATTTAYCEQQYAAHTAGAIAFEESGTEFRMSAYPVLDRTIALADACRDATITITGHSDSSGNESFNQQLSLARAKAVAEHLESRGIAGDRIVTIGAGSSLPIADNATRYGRSINRRIEIRFASRP